MRDEGVGGLLSDFGGAIVDLSEKSSKFTPKRSRKIHMQSREYLASALEHDGPTVAITHHAPHSGSSHPRYRGSAMNPGFVSNCEDLILKTKPLLWVHGHTHDSFDYEIG
jgi:Icc-related predicted phosphoesterase